MNEFIGQVQKFGFKCSKPAVNHDYFVTIEFRKFKLLKETAKVPDIQLKPCLYKKR